MSELLGFVFAMAVIVAFGYFDHQYAKRWNLGISNTNPVAERIVVISDTPESDGLSPEVGESEGET